VLPARIDGRVTVAANGKIVIFHEEREERDYNVPHASEIRVEAGQQVRSGDALTSGASNPQEILHILGTEAVQRYLIDEVQKVYRSQGVNTNEKHMEIIVRQMLRKVQIETPGDTDLLAGELVDRFAYEEINARILAEGGEPATAQTVLLGVTKAALKTDSFLSAASFQETTRVLTEAAIQGSIDRLHGLKENVIIGKLIPAGSGVNHRIKKKARVSLSELLDVDPDNDAQLKHLAELEEEEDAPILPPPAPTLDSIQLQAALDSKRAIEAQQGQRAALSGHSTALLEADDEVRPARSNGNGKGASAGAAALFNAILNGTDDDDEDDDLDADIEAELGFNNEDSELGDMEGMLAKEDLLDGMHEDED
jgi:hypothetical protein